MRFAAHSHRFGAAILVLLFLTMSVWAQGTRPISTLRIGVVVGDNLNHTLRRMEPFRLYLEDRLNRRVTIEGTHSFQNLMEVHARGRIHYAIYSASAYARAWASCRCLEPLAAPKSIGGGSGIYSVLLVAADTRFQSLDDLNNQRVLYTSPSTLAGHLIPARAMSLLSGKDRFVFADADMARNAAIGLEALKSGSANGVFAWEGAEGPLRGTAASAEKRGVIEPGFARSVWRSDLLPHGPHAILSDLPAALIADLRSALINLDPEDDSVQLRVRNAQASNDGQEASETSYTASDILDSIDNLFGGGFSPVDHYDYLPVLNVLGWGTENTVPAWP
ncbi:MAG: PhnD/SsuA/transferrin family substrate-binding protein [Alphaproteobacteria bacterium]